MSKKHKNQGRKSSGPKMSPTQAMEIVDDMDLPDGAALAMAAEMCGMEYEDFIEALGEEQ